jgi:hypothetical protein
VTCLSVFVAEQFLQGTIGCFRTLSIVNAKARERFQGTAGIGLFLLGFGVGSGFSAFAYVKSRGA